MYACRSDRADWYATLGDPFHLIRGGPERAVFRQFGSAKTFQVEPNEFRKVFCTEKTFYTGQNSSDEKEIRDLRGLYRRHFVDEFRKRPENPSLPRTNVIALLSNNQEHNEILPSHGQCQCQCQCQCQPVKNIYPSDKNATRRHDFPMRTRKTHFFGIRKQSRTRQVDIVLG